MPSEAKIEMWRCCGCKWEDQDVADAASEECENCTHRRCGKCVTLFKPVRTREGDGPLEIDNLARVDGWYECWGWVQNTC